MRGAAKAARISGASLGAFVPGVGKRVARPMGRAFKRLSPKTKLFVLLPLTMISLASLVLAGMLIAYTITIPDPLSLRTKVSGPAIRVLARDGAVLAERGTARDYIPLDFIPPRVVNAVIATEDRKFWSHWGVDPSGFARALFVNLRAGRFAQGGSTLTQQLAKNLFLSPERTLGRKLEELVLAVWLELRLSKRDILELYLNRVYFGGGAYGVEAASQRYFDKSARELGLMEAAIIAGLLKAPSRYAPTANPRLAVVRGHSVLAKMREAGFISALEEQRARARRPIFAHKRQDAERNVTDYAIDYVLERLPPVLGSGHREVIIDTTIDRELQRTASHVVAKELKEQGSALAANQAGLVILDTNGGIRAMVGGRAYAQSQFNRAVRAKRQPGSAFKPFVYLAALEKGFTPDSVAYDLPFNLEGWTPKNDNGRFTGAVTLRQALAQSINTVAVRLLMDAGPGTVASLAARLGIDAQLRAEPSLALGTSEVSLLDLTGAYGTFASGGIAVEPHIIRRIRSTGGRVLYARGAPQGDQLVSAASIGALNDMLQTAVRSGTGRRAELNGHPTAGKTGTSQEFRDAWFVGYTAHFVGGVWVGNDNGTPMRRVTGGNLPAQIWKAVMTAAHQGKESYPLPGTGWAGDGGPRLATRADRMPPPELLPWQMPTRIPAAKSPNPATKPVKINPSKAKPAKTSATQPSGPGQFPSDRIGEDFIAKALSSIPGSGETRQALADGRPDDAEDDRNSFWPLPGMMSLGGTTR
jgi:penicillin-binding protein 1A